MKIDRLISIIMILLDNERIGASELAEMFEVSNRTIYRDIDAINMAGIPVSSIPGVGGGFEIMENYKIDKRVFTTADLSAILLSLSSLSNMMRGDEIINALAKVKSFILADKAPDIELKANEINIDISSWMTNSDIQSLLTSIKNALQKSNLLSFEYIAHNGNITSRIVEPYQLVLKNSHWYLQGYCHMREDFRLFRLSRIIKLHILEETFAPKPYDKPILNFSEMLETMQIKIKIRIHKSIMDSVLEYCSFCNFTPDEKEYYIVDFPFIENDFYFNILLGFGDKCVCLEPLNIRSELQRRIQSLAALYI